MQTVDVTALSGHALAALKERIEEEQERRIRAGKQQTQMALGIPYPVGMR